MLLVSLNELCTHNDHTNNYIEIRVNRLELHLFTKDLKITHRSGQKPQEIFESDKKEIPKRSGVAG